jgi:hypothetical protein
VSDDRWGRVEDKVDKIVDKLGHIDVTLVRQNLTLEEHIKRTELLEEIVEPIRAKITMAEGALKLLGLLAVLIALSEGILKIFGH